MRDARSISRIIVVLLAITVAVSAAWTATEAWHHFGGIRTTATIAHCSRTARGTLSCTGSWTIDGRTHTGNIDSAPNAPGRQIAVRVRGDSAYVDNGVGLALVVIPGVLFLFSLWIFIGYSRLTLRRRARAGAT